MRTPGLMALVLAALLLLSACGKRGAPAAPGPAEEIIYPRSYPSR